MNEDPETGDEVVEPLEAGDDVVEDPVWEDSLIVLEEGESLPRLTWTEIALDQSWWAAPALIITAVIISAVARHFRS